MMDREYIEESFHEMVGLGYSVKEAIACLEEDMNVNQDLLKELVKTL
ncbi:hypothetical protein [Priestia abyssalis]|nr:hypothetical protein [Priestia abyssalis]